MQNVNSGMTPNATEAKVEKINVQIERHQALGLEPTPDICKGNISDYLMNFPLRLFGEYFPGRLRWNTWTILDDGSERRGQIMFSGMHLSGYYYGNNIIDGQVSSGATVILSSAVDYIYSPLGKELAVERGKFMSDDAAYRRKKILEVNKDENGKVFNLSSLTRIEGFQWVIKGYNQIQYPEGYLLSPYGFKEVGDIRAINPQDSYFQKLVGTGTFSVNPVPEVTGFAISNAASLAMDMIRATSAPSHGVDYKSEVLSLRDVSFTMEYLLSFAQKEVQKRNKLNAQALQKLEAPIAASRR
ncbi:MAG: hypothetical protein WC022_02685 [Parcubacteria group bacterium]